MKKQRNVQMWEMKNKKQKKNGRMNKAVSVLTAAFVGISLAAVSSMLAEAAEKPKYLKSATYAGDEWVINFWSTEFDHLEEDMKAISEDGFNSIVLVVPWNEFQPGIQPVTYNETAFSRLDQVMQAAAEQELWVELRVGYTWDYYGTEDNLARFRRVVGDQEVQEAWKNYVERVYRTAAAHENFYGGFITWEDYWNYLADSMDYMSGPEHISEARWNGYQDYLESHYTLEEVNRVYGNTKKFRDYSDAFIPQRNHPALWMYYAFYDDFLNRLLSEGQSVFPELSLETRLDYDTVLGEEGQRIGVSHFSTFPCGNSSYTSTMYSISMGQRWNQEITATAALEMMEQNLQTVKQHNEEKPIYIDQLLYTDATEQFSYNARLIESERPVYLENVSPILKRYTMGYAVWAYWNYVNNPLYNNQFALDGKGWDYNRVSFSERNGSRSAHLESFGRLSQECGGRITGKKDHDNYVRFTVDSDRPTTLTVALGEKKQSVQVDGKKDVLLNFGMLNYDKLSFSSDGDVYLDNVQVYNFIQDGQLYDENGNELSCIESIRKLNSELE